MTSSNNPGSFAHGEFWDEYSRAWGEKVQPSIDGDTLGEEWTSTDRTDYVFGRFAQPYLNGSARVVEIGPGGGKFSRRIIENCQELTLVDISSEMLKRANQACQGRAQEVLSREGKVEEIESESIDLVFTYDVFIHLESEEIFRYFAEVNRILKPGGIFSVHTSSFESRWGFLSYLQQLRDHQEKIGTRYGGRMYPLSDGIMRRFAEHSGFKIFDSHISWDDKDIIYALQKARPARPWQLITTLEFFQKFELAERIGGSDQREIYAARYLAAGEPLILVIGNPDNDHLAATASASVPKHPCLVGPQGWETLAGVGIVRFPYVQGIRLSRLISERAQWADVETLPLQLARLLQGLLEAHASGLAHGELGPDFILRDKNSGCLRLFGLINPPAEQAAEMRRRDFQDAAYLILSLTPFCRFESDIAAEALELTRQPEPRRLQKLIQSLRR